jgi:soluble lytic murein transglycosylase
MRQESFFDPSARSSADARGLMQLLPSTAAAVADRHGQPSNDLDLFDPQRNVALGTTHLAELAELYGGDRVRMLAAYNAGASAVAKWDTRFGGLAQDEYVESITYRETRNYVKKILSNYRRYERMYGVPE